MTSQVLARKWRPRRFSEIVGQQHIIGALHNAIVQKRLHHAYLLTGTRGVGKTTIARIMAKSLNCLNPQNGEPCCECTNCQHIDQGYFCDVIEIDAASNRGIDNMRDVLSQGNYSPTEGNYKVFIIDEAHMLSTAAFNAMLKTLEEPPEHVKFILATTDPQKVPITVLSRCLQCALHHLDVAQINQHLKYILEKEQINCDPNATELIARAAAGSMRDALSLLDQAIAFGHDTILEEHIRQMLGIVGRTYLFDLLQYIFNQDNFKMFESIQEIAQRSIGFETILDEIAQLLMQTAQYQIAPTSLEHLTDLTDIQKLASLLPGEIIQIYYQCVINGKKDLPYAPDGYSGFLMTMIRMRTFSPWASSDGTLGERLTSKELADPKSHPLPQ